MVNLVELVVTCDNFYRSMQLNEKFLILIKLFQCFEMIFFFFPDCENVIHEMKIDDEKVLYQYSRSYAHTCDVNITLRM